ncbi:MAG TPA: TonB-dependent receptor [Xanthomonadales bacterium]|nr:TonB-dependent receptor [Xanthomonadales bacterium]
MPQNVNRSNDNCNPFKLVRALILGAALVPIAPLGAQQAEGPANALEEVIVTASKVGAASLQSTPISITALTSDDIERSLIANQRDLTQFVPNLFITENTTLAQVFIRGVGTNAVFAGADPSSTIHLDGVYVGRPAATFSNFLDVERVEVLRGPQGTLYGRNSAGGTINIISRKPGDEVESKFQANIGNESLLQLEGYISGPLSESLSGSFSASHSAHDGYREMILPTAQVDEIDDEDTQSFRGQLRFLTGEDTEILLRADYSQWDQTVLGYDKVLVFPSLTPTVNSVFGDFKRLPDDGPSIYDREDWGSSLEINTGLSEHWSLKSLTAYRENDMYLQADTDNTDLPILITTIDDQSQTFSQEFNLTANFERLSLLVGAFYYDENNDSNLFLQFLVPGTSPNYFPNVKIESWAAFGQATYSLTDRLNLIVGGRYIDEQKTFNQDFRVNLLATGNPIVGPITFTSVLDGDDVTPKFGLDYQLTEEVMAYGSVTKGYKSGGFNFNMTNPTLPDGSQRAFGPEEIWAYEIGAKGEYLNNTLRLNAAAFIYDYTDLQVQSFIVAGVIDITNAADAEIKGVELEILARPTPRLELSAALAYLDATYSSFRQAQITGGGFIDATGNNLNSAPESSASLAAQYVFPLSSGGQIYLRGEYNWQDQVFFTADNNDIETQDSFGLVNASLGYETANGSWRVVLWGKNLSDEEYVTGTAGFPPGGRSGRPGLPLTFGLRFTWIPGIK